MLPMLRIVLLLLLATVQVQNRVDPITEHRCHYTGWVADGSRFRYTEDKKPVSGQQEIDGQLVYAFSTGFRVGQTLHVEGIMAKNNYDSGSFEFNILGGAPIIKENGGADVLHLKFIKQRELQPSGVPTRNRTTFLYLTANTLKNNEWMKPPLKRYQKINGERIFLTITALATEFEVRLSGLLLLKYPYRLPLDYVQFVNALGEVAVFKMYLGGQIMMTPLRAVFPTGGIKPKYNLIIDALPISTNFSIAFTDPENKFGIMLLIKVNGDRKTVILNSRINKSWGKAVRASSFPFKTGIAFEMNIQFFERLLTVEVDSVKLATFDYRALPNFGEMSFYGSLQIRSFTVCEPPEWPKPTEGMYSGHLTKQTFSYSKYDP